MIGLHRLLRSVVILAGVLVAIFLVLRAAPGDPAVLLLGPGAGEAEAAALRQQLGLDQPVAVQLFTFMSDVLRGNFGRSLANGQPVIQLILEALPRTLSLAFSAFLLTLIVAVPAGLVAALYRNGPADIAIRGAIAFIQSIPTFWIGVMLIYIFAVWLHWLPTSGSADWRSLLLPALTLSTFQWPLIVRIVRTSMLDVLNQEYVNTAIAKGLSRWDVYLRHAALNALAPVVTIIAVQFGATISGAVMTEVVFAWPGLGTLALTAVNSRDYPVVQAVVLLTAASVIVANLIADLVCARLDPRIGDAMR